MTALVPRTLLYATLMSCESSRPKCAQVAHVHSPAAHSANGYRLHLLTVQVRRRAFCASQLSTDHAERRRYRTPSAIADARAEPERRENAQAGPPRALPAHHLDIIIGKYVCSLREKKLRVRRCHGHPPSRRVKHTYPSHKPRTCTFRLSHWPASHHAPRQPRQTLFHGIALSPPTANAPQVHIQQPCFTNHRGARQDSLETPTCNTTIDKI